MHLWHTLKVDDDVVVEGVLLCSGCGAEYPILDGIPMLVPKLRQVVQDSLFQIIQREDLSPTMRTLLGDCCGPDGAWDTTQQHASTYCWDHWGDFDPAEEDLPAPGSIARLAKVAADALETDGPLIDLGCGPGRATVELARDRPVLGVDLNINLLRHAQRILRRGRCSYPRRRSGLVYDRRDFPIQADLSNVDFWCCDARSLPFADDTFTGAVALNLLDSISEPEAMLKEAFRVSSGAIALSSPFDWSGTNTPVEKWLGGHSQRGGYPDGVAALKDWLKKRGKKVFAEEDLPWALRLHDRSTLHYRTWLGGIA